MPMLLELERELAGPEGPAALERHDAVLVALDARLGAALHDGMAPDEYGKAEELRHAVTLARKLLRLACRQN